MIQTVGSVCSGIEAASVAWLPLGVKFSWFSEISDFPSKVLEKKYPEIPNLGDMNEIPDKIKNNEVVAPDFICAGTPCQAYSFAGWKKGLNDDRGNLTLKFVEIVQANDEVRAANGESKTIIFWENVEGVLSDKTNAFGCMISSLAGFSDVIEKKKWPSAGLVQGPERNVAWRVMDAKFFGLPQQRKRLYLLAGGKDFHPEDILFEEHYSDFEAFPSYDLTFEKDGHRFEVFREYTDCLYSAYGTKWNGNAAANNGSLFVVQDDRLRRLSPIECERLMGFPDEYTQIIGARKTNRYQATGNSWAVPVVKWIGRRILNNPNVIKISADDVEYIASTEKVAEEGYYFDFGCDLIQISDTITLNTSTQPENCVFATMKDIISADAPKDIYISPVGCMGILRRAKERHLSINKRLSEVLSRIADEMSPEEIEKRSRVQKRGRYSK